MIIIKKSKEQKKIYFGVTAILTNPIFDNGFFPMNYTLRYYKNGKGSFIFLINSSVTFTQFLDFLLPNILDKMDSFDILSIDTILIPSLLKKSEEFKIEQTIQDSFYLLDSFYIIHEGKIFYIHDCLTTTEIDKEQNSSSLFKAYSDNDDSKGPDGILKELQMSCKDQIETCSCFPIIIGNDQTTDLSINYSDGTKGNSSLEEFLCQQ